ncbi:gliding motility-associated C-terminal domain-containing protein, partial [Flavobacterium aquidurense]|uniref:T9SS type B sorting domain-containing protein n=1 Tax=Flavobacterium aquidurense TaxID=362413 RepID=UPI00285A1AD6
VIVTNNAPSSFPIGNTIVTWTATDAAGNTQTCTQTVKVVGPIKANDDIVLSLNGYTGGTAVSNVLSNDFLNCSNVITDDVNLTLSNTLPSVLNFNTTTGSVTVNPQTPAGTYSFDYTICEKSNPTNCSIASVTITVFAPIIDAVTETTSPINGTIGGTTPSLVLNDTLNGAAVVIGTNPGEVILSPVSFPTGLILNADGTVKVGAGTPAGMYSVEYKICEVNNPTNCDGVISAVVVTGGVLQANSDTIGSVVGVNQPTILINVFANDTNNNLPVVLADMNLSVLTADPTGFVTLNPDGTAILGANTPAGTYELIYQICEKLNPTNCSSASIKVTVIAPTMTVTANSYCSNDVPYVSYNVTADNFTPNNLLTIKWIDSANNVVATQTNLPLSGNILWPGAVVDNNGIGIDWPGWLLANGQWIEGADGFEKTRTGVTMQFSLNPTVDVVVNYPPATPQCNARPTFVIQANNDTAGTNKTINVFNNDTLNGSVVNPSSVVLSTVTANPYLILNADGSVQVKMGAPSGNYQLTYQICDALNLSNCSQATVSVDVSNVSPPPPPAPTKQIIATDDTATSVDGINGSLEFINVLENDLLNGLVINPANIVIKNIPQSPYFEFNTDGTVNVKPNTPGGNYALIYQICEKANSSNCITATLNVFVEVPAIAIIKTAIFNDENASGFANAGETITYKFKVTNTGNVPLKGITVSDPLTGIVLSGNAIDLDVNESDDSNFTAKYKITQKDINFGSVSNQAIVQGKSERGVIVDDKSDDSTNAEDKPTILTLNGCEIKVLNAFSPNGDSKNERFYIQGLECYPDNTVEIYNRWGVLVFDTDHYNNEDRAFIGISAGRSTIKQADGLPVGTYFYILKYKDSDSNLHELSGYLYITK